MTGKKTNIKKILSGILWVVIGGGIVALSVAAMKRQNDRLCKGIEVSISGVNNNFFIDKKDVLQIINDATGGTAEGKPVAAFNLLKIEAALEKDVWVDNAELYFDNNGLLQATVEEREPVARIFTNSNNSFYIDTAAMMLPLSGKFSARLPVFTGFTSDAKVLSHEDSALLFDIRKMSMAIQSDSFLMGMIDQVDITKDREFELTPKIGTQTILFGDASEAGAKFEKLKLFYKSVMMKTGWNRYSSIDLRYRNQVVAKIKGKEDVLADADRTLQLMDFMAKTAAMQAADSAKKFVVENDNIANDVSAIQQSTERDEGPETTEDNYPVTPVIKETTPAPVVVKAPVAPSAKPLENPVVKPPVKKPAAIKKVTTVPQKKPAVVQKKTIPQAKPVQQPKIVMPKKNEY